MKRVSSLAEQARFFVAVASMCQISRALIDSGYTHEAWIGSFKCCPKPLDLRENFRIDKFFYLWIRKTMFLTYTVMLRYVCATDTCKTAA
jgi:hypothetical protein